DVWSGDVVVADYGAPETGRGAGAGPRATGGLVSAIGSRTSRRAQHAGARRRPQRDQPIRPERLSTSGSRFRQSGRDEFAPGLRAVVVFAPRRRRNGVIDRLRERGEFVAVARLFATKRNRCEVGAGRKSLAVAAAIIDRKRIAVCGRRRVGVGVRNVDQGRLARGRRLGASPVATEAGLARAELHAGLGAVDRNLIWISPGLARYESGFDADAQRQRAQFERRFAFVAQSWSGGDAGRAIVVTPGGRGIICAHAVEFAARRSRLQYEKPAAVQRVAELDRLQRRAAGSAL